MYEYTLNIISEHVMYVMNYVILNIQVPEDIFSFIII